MSLGGVKRGFEVLRTEGALSLIRKLWNLANVLTVRKFALSGQKVNSEAYWDKRLRLSWNSVGGGIQTQQFATSMVANLCKKELGSVETVLDFGCATGDSVPVLAALYPSAHIYLHDLAESGVNKGLKKYGAYYTVSKWTKGQSVDMVYSSNVIEHVEDLDSFVNELLSLSNRIVVIQCPWKEIHADGARLTPSNPVGEHIWTVDDEFLDRHFNVSGWTWSKTVTTVPLAWPGEQLILVGVKSPY